jgi:hypothetical protein
MEDMTETGTGASGRVRDFIVDALRRELVGPDPGLPAVQTGIGARSVKGEEILRQEDPPRLRYGAGVLFPQQTTTDEQENNDAPEAQPSETDENADPGAGQAEPGSSAPYRSASTEIETEQEINRANEYLPSALGLTALVRIPETLIIEIDAGRYEAEEMMGQAGWEDRSGTFHPYRGWRRIPIRTVLEIERKDLLSRQVIERSIPTGTDQVTMKLHVFVREAGIHGTDAAARMVTFTLLNDTPGGGRRNDECIFQCSFRVRSAGDDDCFLEYPDRLEASDIGAPASEAGILAEEEGEGMRLLYRHRRVFAVGHGCAPEWTDSTTQSTTMVRTETLPVYEVPPVLPSELEGLDLRMEPLADDEDAGARTGERLCDMYAEWIKALRDAVSNGEIPSDLITAGERNIGRAEDCLKRMREGVHILRETPRARRAFAQMNRAMLMQQIHHGLSQRARKWHVRDGVLALESPYQPPQYSGTNRRWRPFQFAFVLLNLRSIVEPDHPDRQIVDVIWFPTGGGKTEAYLGLAAFTILFRRMLDPAAGGTVVLTRYTLRLLTTQQYQRAASLICALEYLRRRHEGELGSDAITIGLWVGGGVTPNREDQAIEALNRMLREGGRENKFVLLSCPWCGAGMGAYESGKSYRVAGYRRLHAPLRVRHICDDPACEFNDDRGLPVLVTDEAIYEAPPTLVIGTVDKFALMPWYREASAIFGLMDGQRRYPPPELIIQDELHLISGPLGSMVGHYETVIGELCASATGIPVKVVASTATIARAAEQVRALYGREESFLFPPQGLEWGSSFFAEERRDLPGRYYLGVFATALPSQQTAMVRVVSSLLQSPLLIDSTPAAIDPYWTLVAYFNSIRELGSAATLVSADIPEYMKVLHRRLGLTREWSQDTSAAGVRRWLRTPTLELTSRVPSGEISSTLEGLFDPFTGELGSAVDVCLATNMIQVGLDVSRLGLMTVAGQPKTTSEYIQATSRVGREKPGLVVVLLNPSKPRDRSHYEHFRAYHERIYSSVEPTSVTPFALPVRDRALHALMVTLARFWGDENLRRRPDPPLAGELSDRIRQVILQRVAQVDHEATPSIQRWIEHILHRWTISPPPRYGGFGPPDEEVPLMYPYGSEPLPAWNAHVSGPPWPTPSSMRNVDASCDLDVVRDYFVPEDGKSL